MRKRIAFKFDEITANALLLVKAQADPASIHNEVIRLLEEIMGR